ncbi:TadE/TadG family type IV pilus assembly protein [Aureimonas sp. AU22]|uniref:TadE/TadG family type IV pilus assembly protein n=1 Tax=Aureimonas sp. AU22 TaxID=1638162 RepID=UPI00078057DA|nr:TadE/TadG family type IV pilus assembly protein [Aureimonas sp. AU22]
MPFAREIRSFYARKDGVTAVEFGLLATPFFLVVFFILETSLVFMAETSINNAVERVAREVRLGSPIATTDGELRSLICAEVGYLLDCEKLHIDLRRYPTFEGISIPPIVQDGSIATTFEAGESSIVMSLRVAYEWPIITNFMQRYLSTLESGNHLIVVGTFLKSEPY